MANSFSGNWLEAIHSDTDYYFNWTGFGAAWMGLVLTKNSLLHEDVKTSTLKTEKKHSASLVFAIFYRHDRNRS